MTSSGFDLAEAPLLLHSRPLAPPCNYNDFHVVLEVLHQATAITAVPNRPGSLLYTHGILQLISAISMKNGDKLDLDGGGLGNLKLVYFPSMISNTGAIVLGNNNPDSDSFKGTAFFPSKLLAGGGRVTVGSIDDSPEPPLQRH